MPENAESAPKPAIERIADALERIAVVQEELSDELIAFLMDCSAQDGPGGQRYLCVRIIETESIVGRRRIGSW